MGLKRPAPSYSRGAFEGEIYEIPNATTFRITSTPQTKDLNRKLKKFAGTLARSLARFYGFDRPTWRPRIWRRPTWRPRIWREPRIWRPRIWRRPGPGDRGSGDRLRPRHLHRGPSARLRPPLLGESPVIEFVARLHDQPDLNHLDTVSSESHGVGVTRMSEFEAVARPVRRSASGPTPDRQQRRHAP